MPDDDLACDCPTALPLVGGIILGAALTTWWVARSPDALRWLGQ